MKKSIILLILFVLSIALVACSTNEDSLFSSLNGENRENITISYSNDISSQSGLNASITLVDSEAISGEDLEIDPQEYNERVEAYRLAIINELDKIASFNYEDTSNVKSSSDCLVIQDKANDIYLRLYEDGSAVYRKGDTRNEIAFISKEFQNSYSIINENLLAIEKELLDYIGYSEN